MTVIQAVTPKAAAVQPIATDLEAMGGAAANHKQAGTPIFKDYGLPNDGHGNHNRIKGGAVHLYHRNRKDGEAHCRICQTSAASPAEPGDLPTD